MSGMDISGLLLPESVSGWMLALAAVVAVIVAIIIVKGVIRLVIGAGALAASLGLITLPQWQDYLPF